MKSFVIYGAIFLFVYLSYFAVATNFTYIPQWEVDYFNPLATSLRMGRLDIPNPPMTRDLAYFGGKWYLPWGILPALILIPLQLLKGGYVPTLYLSLFFASANAVIVFLLLTRLKNEFLPSLSNFGIMLLLLLFLFGTTHFYIGTLGSVWHVQQMVSSFFVTCGIYFIFRKKRSYWHYVASVTCFSIVLLGRPTNVLLVVIPLLLYFIDQRQSRNKNSLVMRSGIIAPLIIGSIIFALYNLFRFGNAFDYGQRYILEEGYLADRRETGGIFSIRNVPYNAWYLFFEIPRLTLTNDRGIELQINLIGNSIFFLTPPLLAAFLVNPITRKQHKRIVDPYTSVLWIAVIVTLVPNLLHYSTGWMQFGYRYSLDILVPLLLLSIFGIKGKLNVLYIGAIFWSICLYVIGIRLLM